MCIYLMAFVYFEMILDFRDMHAEARHPELCQIGMSIANARRYGFEKFNMKFSDPFPPARDQR